MTEEMDNTKFREMWEKQELSAWKARGWHEMAEKLENDDEEPKDDSIGEEDGG